jgi:hypothetical protein
VTNGLSAHRVVAAADAGLDADDRDRVLKAVVDEVDRGCRRRAHRRRETGEGFETGIGLFAENAILRDRIGAEGVGRCRHGHCLRKGAAPDYPRRLAAWRSA